MAACGHRLHNANTNHKVAEGFALLTLPNISTKNRCQESNNLILSDRFGNQRVETFSDKVPPQVHVVGPRCLSDESDLSHGWSTTGIGATRHADDNVPVAKATPLHNSLQATDQGRQVSLSFGKSQ